MTMEIFRRISRGARNAVSVHAIHAILPLVAIASASAEPLRYLTPSPGIANVHSVPQNWTDEEANAFYNIPQGSLLLPYDWFLKLEQPDAQQPFRSAEYMRSIGYLTRK